MYEIARGVQRKKDHTESFLTYEHPFLGLSKPSFGTLLQFQETLLRPGAEWNSGLIGPAEIVTFVQDGRLAITAEGGSESRLETDGIHCLTVGAATEFQVKNLSEIETSNYLQVWLDTSETETGACVATGKAEMTGRGTGLVPLASGQEETAAVPLRQDVAIYLSRMRPSENLIFETLPSRRVFLAVVNGVIRVEEDRLVTADSLMIRKESLIEIAAQQRSELLLVDLP